MNLRLGVAIFALAAGPAEASAQRATKLGPSSGDLRPVRRPSGETALREVAGFFVENQGQWQHPAHLVARLGAMTVFVEDRGWRFTLEDRVPGDASPPPTEAVPGGSADGMTTRGVAVRMTFEGARTPKRIPEARLPGHFNYFLGNDPRRWRTGVPGYQSVLLEGVYPGIDVRLREKGGFLEYDIVLQPGADLGKVVIRVEGVSHLDLGPSGDLRLRTGVGEIEQPSPKTWARSPSGEQRPVHCSHVILAGDRFGFEVPDRPTGCGLWIDPGLTYSTFLGAAGDDFATAVALDGSGAATVVGYTNSPGYPTTLGAYDTTYNGGWGLPNGYGDAFVTRLSPSGSSLVYSTFLGGTANDWGLAVAVGASGAAVVAGLTDSLDFPLTTGALDTTFNGGSTDPLGVAGGDGFVTRLSPSGAILDYSTYLGGAASDDFPLAVQVDASGAATVAGFTSSVDFPVTAGGYDTTHDFYEDAFIVRLSSSGTSLLYGTFLGGSAGERANALALDSTGAATITGWTGSPDFPTTPGAFDTVPGFWGSDSVFVTRLSPLGSMLDYSTFIDGSASSEKAYALALDSSGAATVAGETYSTDFPVTPGAFDTTQNGDYDVFVTRLSPSGGSLAFSTYLGGVWRDSARGLGLDASGAPTVVGGTISGNFPTTPGSGSLPLVSQAFVSRLTLSGAGLAYSALLGGAWGDWAVGVQVEPRGDATVVGITGSPDYPTTPGAFDTTLNGPGGFADAFVTKLDGLPTGVSGYGNSTPGCGGPLPIGVISWPQVGEGGFAITCGNAPANSAGLLGVSVAGLTAPLVLIGAEVWIDPAAPVFILLPAGSGALGSTQIAIPLPPDPLLAGTQSFVQFFWLDTCAPGGVSASYALAVTVQP